MFKMYLKIALRNFVKEKFFSVINTVGLAVGISVALLIALYIHHELAYDRFHTKHERIFRIASYFETGGNGSELNSTFPPLAAAVQTEIPEIEQAVRLMVMAGRIFKEGNKVFSEDRVLYADSAFFSVFDYKMLVGDPKTALAERNMILLTPSLAKKYFNTDDYASVVGKSILIDQEDFSVTGIVEESRPDSHIIYSAIASMESLPMGRDKTWNSMNVSLYVLLKPNTQIDAVIGKIPSVFDKYIPSFKEFVKHGIVIRPTAMPITDIHLKSNVRGEYEPGGSMMNIYIFGGVALIVLFLASVNFVNLLTARSANRAKEVGVRKVLGSARGNLVRQFLFECVLLVAISTLLALGTVELLRGPFTVLLGKALPFEKLLSLDYVFALVTFIFVLGLLAGIYPAFFLSSFQPAQVLKGKIRSGFKSSGLRNTLVTLQFLISMVLIACTLVMQHQLDFMRSKKLGFDKDNVLVIDNADRLPSEQAFIDAVENLSFVELAGAATSKPVDDYDGMVITTQPGKENRQTVNYSRVDDHFIAVMKYEFVEGRNFSRDHASDSAAVIINERAADLLYGGENPIGKKIYNDIEYTVIGVIKDFNFESLKNEVRPLVFYNKPNERYVHLRLKPGNYENAIATIEKLWKEQTSEIPFAWTFLDATYNDLFKQEVKLGSIFSIFTCIGLFIACLGLMGLTAYMAEQRKKEISVRKVLGATVAQVMLMMSKDFMKILAIAFFIAVPLSWYLMDQWLSSFVYRTSVSIDLLLVGGVAVVVTAFLAISYQALRAAILNPIDSLKDE